MWHKQDLKIKEELEKNWGRRRNCDMMATQANASQLKFVWTKGYNKWNRFTESAGFISMFLLSRPLKPANIVESGQSRTEAVCIYKPNKQA